MAICGKKIKGMPARSPTIADPTTAFIFGLSLVVSFRCLLILKVKWRATVDVASRPAISSGENFVGLKRFLSGENVWTARTPKKAMNPAFPPTFGMKGPMITLMRVAARAAKMRILKVGRISGEAIPTNAPV